MGYNGASIDAYINLNLGDFESDITKVEDRLKKLQTGFNDIPTSIQSSLKELNALNDVLEVAVKDAKGINQALENSTAIASLTSEVNNLKTELTQVREELNTIKSTTQTVTNTITSTVAEAEKLYMTHKNITVELRNNSDLFNLLEQKLTSLVSIGSSFERLTQEFNLRLKQTSNYVSDIGASWNRTLSSLSQSARLVKETAWGTIDAKNKMNEISVSVKEVTTAFKNQKEEIVAQGRALLEIKDQIIQLTPYQRKVLEQIQEGNGLTRIQKRILEEVTAQEGILISKEQERAMKIAEATNLMKELESMTITVANETTRIGSAWNRNNTELKRYVSELETIIPTVSQALGRLESLVSVEERGVVGLEKMNTSTATLSPKLLECAEIMQRMVGYTEEDVAEMKRLNQEAKKTSNTMKGMNTGNRKNSLDQNILRRTGSMFATMFLFNEAMEVAEGSVEVANGIKKLDYWQGRLTKDLNYSSSAFTKLRTELYSTYKGGKSLVELYPKVDMTSVASSTLEAVDKYKLVGQDLGQLTEIYAVASSQFAKEGRSQEDSILAVNDALDGEFRRLKEIGITQDSLKKNGWNGDLQDKASLIQALNKNMEQLGYNKTAQQITSISDSLDILKIKLETAFGRFIHFISPTVIKSAEQIGWVIDQLIYVCDRLYTTLDNIIPTGAKKGITEFTGTLLTLGIGFYIVKKLATAFGLLNTTGTASIGIFGKLKNIFGGKVNNGGIVNGGIMGGKYSGDWKTTMKNGFLGQIEQVGKDVGMYTRIIIGVTFAMATIWVALEELALIGARYKNIEPNVKKGVQAIEDTAIIIAPIMGAVALLNYAMGSGGEFVLMDEAKGLLATSFLLAEVMFETALVIGLLIPPIYAISSIGGMFNPSQVQQGATIIKQTADIILPIALAVGVLGAVMGVGAEVVAPVLAVGMLIATGIIVEGIVEVTAIIEAIKLPIMSLVSIGSSFNPSDVNRGASILNGVANGLRALANAMGSLTDINWANFKSNIIGGSDIGALNDIADKLLPKLVIFTARFNQEVKKMQPLDGNASKVLQSMATVTNQLRSSAVQMGQALSTGFRSGSGNFSSVVRSAVNGGLNTVKGLYGGFKSQGGYLAHNFATGFKNSFKIKDVTYSEIHNTLVYLDGNKQNFYNKGFALGQSFANGYHDGNDMHSPGLVARSTEQEVMYALQSIDSNVSAMYRSGFSLGSAFANGYNKTDMSLVKNGATGSSGGSNGGLKIKGATSNGNTVTTNNSKKNTVVNNFNFEGANFFGLDDVEGAIREIAQQVFFEQNSPSRATGY